MIQELDAIKQRKLGSSLGNLARKAVNFIYEKLRMEHPRLIGNILLLSNNEIFDITN